jgi:hypothetical protein
MRVNLTAYRGTNVQISLQADARLNPQTCIDSYLQSIGQIWGSSSFSLLWGIRNYNLNISDQDLNPALCEYKAKHSAATVG